MNEINNNKKNNIQNYDNPPQNIGAIFEKCNSTSSYFIIKVTLDGKNHTLCGFKNKNHSGEEYSKEPLYYLFPYRPRNRENNNNQEDYNRAD